MKTLLTLIALASTLSAVQAGSCPPPVKATTACAPKAAAKPAYAYTRQLSSRTECRWAKDKCGKRVRFEVSLITYVDYFTDGSQRTYTKEVRA